MKNKEIKINDIIIGNKKPLTLMAGPCVVESYEHSVQMISKIKSITEKLGINYIYKSSFDKANRTSINSSRGPGLNEALEIFKNIKDKFGCSIMTDVHDISHVKEVAEVVDLIQIPAFLCRQTDLLIESAKTNKPVMVKKGQFLAPWDMKNVIEKIVSNGNGDVLLCERGASFGYNTLVSDFRS